MIGDQATANANKQGRVVPLCGKEPGPARVLHHALELAGIARTGPIPPFVSELSAEQRKRLAPVVQDLLMQQQVLVSGD